VKGALLPASTTLAGFWLRFVGSDGVDRRFPLASVAEYAFELASPVRSFLPFRGQRNNTGFLAVTRSGATAIPTWPDRLDGQS
jgi:hypothetical protein